MKKNKLNIILFIILIFYTFSLIHMSMPNDVFFTIPTGNYILTNGLDNTDTLTFHDNLNFVKVRYGFDILISSIYNLFGFVGLYIFTVLMSIIIVSSLYITITKVIKSPIISFIISLIAISVCSEYLVCRAQLISYLVFILEIYFLFKLSNTGKTKYIVILTLLSVILLAFHASVWIVYLVFFVPYIASWLLKIINNKVNFFSEHLIFEDSHIKKIFITLILVLISGFLTPLGLYPYTYSFMNISTSAKEVVSELQPLTLLHTPILLIISLLFAVITIFSRSKTRIVDLFYVIGGIIMSLYVERNLYIAIFMMGLPIARTIESFMDVYNISKYRDKLELFINNHIIIGLMLIIVFVPISSFKYSTIINEKLIDESSYPVGAVNYLKTNTQISNVRLFTDYNFGSYTEYQGIKAFIDSRSEIFTHTFSNVSILDDWISIEYPLDYDENVVRTNIEDLIEKYSITHFLCYNNAEYIDIISKDEKFNIIYKDDYFTLFKILE